MEYHFNRVASPGKMLPKGVSNQFQHAACKSAPVSSADIHAGLSANSFKIFLADYWQAIHSIQRNASSGELYPNSLHFSNLLSRWYAQTRKNAILTASPAVSPKNGPAASLRLCWGARKPVARQGHSCYFRGTILERGPSPAKALLGRALRWPVNEWQSRWRGRTVPYSLHRLMLGARMIARTW